MKFFILLVAIGASLGCALNCNKNNEISTNDLADALGLIPIRIVIGGGISENWDIYLQLHDANGVVEEHLLERKIQSGSTVLLTIHRDDAGRFSYKSSNLIRHLIRMETNVPQIRTWVDETVVQHDNKFLASFSSDGEFSLVPSGSNLSVLISKRAGDGSESAD